MQHGRQGELIGSAPSDEELAAYLEGVIDASRRAQISAYLAHDNETYQRWLRCITANAERMAPVIETVQKVGFLSRLGSLFEVRNSALGGGLLAAAIAAVLLVQPIFFGGGVNQQIDKLYGDYSPQIDQRWGQVSDFSLLKEYSSNRSFSLIPKTYSKEQRLMQSGFRQGAESLGVKKFTELNINLDAMATDAADNEEQELIYALGRVAALGYMGCKLGLPADDFSKLAATIELLLTEPVITKTDQLNALQSAYFSDKSRAKAVCHFSKAAYESMDI